MKSLKESTVVRDKVQAKDTRNSKKEFEDMVDLFMKPIPQTQFVKVKELEVRFGTNTKLAKPISKIDYDNVVQSLVSAGFVKESETHLLRIQTEYNDPRTGFTKISNIRAELSGLDLIQEYCKHNSIQKILDMPSTMSAMSDKIKFTQKSPPTGDDGKLIKMVDMPEFNFRVSYQLEQDYSPHSNLAKTIINKWNDSKKVFRYINRVRFAHPTHPVFADLSIVKMSKKTNYVPIPQYTIKEAGVFANQEQYEIELELDNDLIGPGTRNKTSDMVIGLLRSCIRTVLGGLQGTHYPISYNERDSALQSYMKLIHGDEYKQRRVYSNDFIGPSSYTLEIKNVTSSENTTAPNILTNYTVTDKADGERRLLFISDEGKIYMIDTNMNVIFTGSSTKDITLFNSLIDGEHIKYDKHENFINLFAAFDIYYKNNVSVRELNFVPLLENDLVQNFRLPILSQFIQRLNTDKTNIKSPCTFQIKCKTFYDGIAQPIFKGCATILSNVADGIYEYNTDGLIFTPINKGAGGDESNKSGPLHKTTWAHSFKWKPPQFNTIDFLVSIKKITAKTKYIIYFKTAKI